MPLGEKAQIVFNVKDLKESVAFYRRIGFRLLSQQIKDKDWALLTDDAIFILLNEDDETFSGITYLAPDMPQRAAGLEQSGLTFEDAQTSDDGIIQATLYDPNGIGVSLVRFNPTGLPNLDLNTETRCGIFGEYFIATDDYNKSVEFWKNLTFQPLHTQQTPYPHGVFSDGHLIIGLHERDAEFDKPALSYFAPDMEMRLNGMKLEDIEFAKEYQDDDGKVRNAVLQSPDGYPIFLFQGDFSAD